MLIRFVAKNIFSFKGETEFNLLPNKTQRLPHHKITRHGLDFLRLSALYGANGSGKSNLVKAIALLESMLMDGKLIDENEEIKFKLSSKNSDDPISLAIEFYAKNKIYYYSLSFDKGVILNEYFAESKKENDLLIFERSIENGIQNVNFFDEYTNNNDKNKLFVEVLEEKLLQKNELLLSFLNSKYKDEFEDVVNCFEWFDKTLVIIRPETKAGGIAHLLDIDSQLKNFANTLFPTLNTGISKIDVEKKPIEDFFANTDTKGLKSIIDNLKKEPDGVSLLTHSETGEEASLVYEDDKAFVKRLITSHKDDKGGEVDFPLGMESDGTKRLIDYIPALRGIIVNEQVFIIDEIERSIHPIMIKEIITKISLDESAKGQLIFTTHESCLLDQDILRADEIWFAQKDIDGASRLYSLSEFNIHNTANIQNGYLNGRYGGIPFLSNLHDLNWHKYEVS